MDQKEWKPDFGPVADKLKKASIEGGVHHVEIGADGEPTGRIRREGGAAPEAPHDPPLNNPDLDEWLER